MSDNPGFDTMTRRCLLKLGLAGAGMSLVPGCSQDEVTLIDLPLKLSLAQWSLHRHYFGGNIGEVFQRNGLKTGEDLWRTLRTDFDGLMSGPLNPLDFAPFARENFDVSAVEYVNTFYFDKAGNDAYVNQLDERARGAGVKSVLVMCDGLGELGAPDAQLRRGAVENHLPWLEFAQGLGCHAIRVNAASDPELNREEQSRLATDGLAQLCKLAENFGLSVIVENHGGLSSDGKWLSEVVQNVQHPLIGTLPDFGNFNISASERYDPYQGVAELLPFAKGVSAKTYAFDPETGLETTLDYGRLLDLVKTHKYQGYVGIEYEGNALSEIEGIAATRSLIERLW